MAKQTRSVSPVEAPIEASLPRLVFCYDSGMRIGERYVAKIVVDGEVVVRYGDESYSLAEMGAMREFGALRAGRVLSD